MSDFNSIKAQIRTLIDSANATTGNADTNLTDSVNALIGGYGQGGSSGGSLEGLENGYDVMFYDENNEGLAFYSIKQGHSINAPVYTVKSWQTEDGGVITFPYTPSADVVLYANNDTYADKLYDFYGLDSAEYPYIFIYNYQTQWAVIFGNTLDTSNKILNDVFRSNGWTYAGKFTGSTTLEFVEFVMAGIPLSNFVSEASYNYGSRLSTSGTIIGTNFELGTTSASVVYNLV